MLSRIVFIESRLNLSQKLIPALNLSICEGKFNYSTSLSFHNEKKSSVSRHVKSSVPSFGNKAKEATKTTYYTAVVVAGLGAFGLMMYAIFRELLSSFSPQSVYSAAVDRICFEPNVTKLFGENIKCFGETSRRGRRQHINHFPYEVEGRKGIRIKFYLQGQYRSGTVHLDARTCSSGWEFRYLFVQSDSYPHQVVVVEDNRTIVDNQPIEESSSALFSLPSLKES